MQHGVQMFTEILLLDVNSVSMADLWWIYMDASTEPMTADIDFISVIYRPRQVINLSQDILCDGLLLNKFQLSLQCRQTVIHKC